MPKVSKVMKVMKVMMGEVMEVGEVVSWKHRAMVERVGHAKAVWAAEALHATSAVHPAKAVRGLPCRPSSSGPTSLARQAPPPQQHIRSLFCGA